MTKKYSIEYAHIYTNEPSNKEHDAYIDILRGIMKDNLKEEVSLVVMIDDYSFPDPGFDYEKFFLGLQDNDIKPNLTLRESQLIPYCDTVIKLIQKERLKGQIQDYIISTKKYPCSLFIATWYLMRLGKIPSILLPESEIAEKIINILPESFLPFEEKGLEIIKTTEYRNLLGKIENRYFDGRLIA